ncbi:MAG TPA: PTS glucitol/sorbitol transporter subunit IIC [Lactovum miscens]|uniref:PTS glucitol/sorbitol transporter subunit IIC n=1 Tax=Lactovum miscens TaxID=190387 RepID=UPI002ED79118
MEIIVDLAKGFVGLFQQGGTTFVGWMTGIVPVVLMLLVFMNALIALIGQNRIEGIARHAGSNPFSRYLILPFISAFMLGNPASFTMGKFLPEYYKPGYYAALAQYCHTSNGVFPHINPGELFVWLGIAQGIQKLGLNQMDLAIRYLLVGLVMNFIGGWVTEFIVGYVQKQQHITLSKEVKAS